MRILSPQEFPHAVCDECLNLIKPVGAVLVGECSILFPYDGRQAVLYPDCITKAFKLWSAYEAKR